MQFKPGILLGAVILGGFLGLAHAGDATVSVTIADASSAAAAGSAADASSAADAGSAPPSHGLHFGGHARNHRHDNTLVSVGHGVTLPEGEHADNVVTVMGSSTVAGEVFEDVVSVMGNTRVTGPVAGDVVAVMGNSYIDSPVAGDVVAVMGNIELGPNAEIGGEINAVGGSVKRHQAAITHGDVDTISSGMQGWDFEWLQNWVTNCLMKGRLLSFSHGLGWAWTVALVSLAFYVLAAAMMRRSVGKYVQVLENSPGESLLAAFLTLVGTPVLMMLLCITVIGILAIPFLGIALLLAASFGRIVILAWIGTRVVRPTGTDAWSHPAATVLIGGLIVTALYTVPVVGMITFQLIGFIGMGVVAYGLLLALRERRQSNGAPLQHAAASVPGAAAMSAAAVMPGAPPAPGAAPSTDTAIPGTAIPGTATPGTPGAGAAMPGAAMPGTPMPGATVPGATMPASMAAATYPRAGFWIRMFALLIDLLLVSVIVHLMFIHKGVDLPLLAAYGAVMWKLKGTTLGGMICHLHVVRLDGRELDWSTAIVRALGCFLSLIVAGLGFIWIAIDSERQAWHDKIAGTVVVRVPKGVSLV